MTNTKMVKAYDFKDLRDRLKQAGLDLGEEGAEKVLGCVFPWLKESAKISSNRMDDMIAPLLVPLEAYVMTHVDKIDGKVG